MQADTLIIGCGIAGATAALRLSQDRQRQIVVLTRTADPLEANSRYAQGGIVGRGMEDDPDLLANDILQAGAGLSYPPAVKLISEEGPRLLEKVLLEAANLEFDRDDQGNFIFGLEAAHSRRRILHMGDKTGLGIMTGLLKQIIEQPNITLLTSHTVVDLITFPHHATDPLTVYNPVTCHGAYVFDEQTNKVEQFLASEVILATGGIGQIFQNTTNPPGARGDGLAMAYRAGARVVNTEYIQFHPTALHSPGVTKFLISEAVRGEGGILINPDGEEFMQRYSPEWKDLAPRDIVARAIYWEMLEKDYHFVYLDIAHHKEASFIKDRFPNIYETCKLKNIDITREPVPVVPAAHYFCGGVLVDLWGQTSITGLYAVGEVACSGVHGANRLASTSLLEGLVWGYRAAEDIRRKPSQAPIAESRVPSWDDGNLIYDADPTLIQGDMQTIRNLMWHYVGLVRSDYRLNRAIRELRHLWLDIEDFYRKTRLTDGLIGLRNSVESALIVARSAYHNKISRGCHYREDSFRYLKSAQPPEDQYIKLSGGLN